MRTRFVAVFLLVLSGLAPAAAQTPSTPTAPPPPTAVDLSIDAVTLDGPIPYRTNGNPSPPIDVKTVVHNRGPTQITGYQLTYAWESGTQQTPLKGTTKPSNSVDVIEDPLPAGGTHTRRFQWPLQPEQSGTGRVRVLVEAISGNGRPPPADNHPEDNVGRLLDPVLIVERALALTWASGAQEIHPQETIFLDLQVANQGNAAEQVTLSLVPPQGDAKRVAVDFSDSLLTVAGGTTRKVQLYVTYPDDGNSASFSIRLGVRASATDGRVVTTTTPVISSTTQPLKLENYKSILERNSPGLVFASPGTPTIVEWTAANTGTAPDTYAVEIDAEPGWIFEAIPTRLGMEPGARAQIQVKATPVGLPAGRITSVIVALNSTHLALDAYQATRTESDVTLQVAGPAPEIIAAWPEEPHFYRGEGGTFLVELRNRGNQAIEGPTQVGVELRMANNSTRIVNGLAPTLVPGQVVLLRVPAGVFPVAGQAQYTVVWQVAGPLGQPTATGQVEVHAPSISIRAPTALQGRPGEAVTYGAMQNLFVVRNDGGNVEQLALEAQAERGKGVLLGPAALSLTPGEERLVAVRHLLPSAAQGDTDRLTLRASIAGRDTLNWEDSVQTKLVDATAPLITVKARHSQWNLDSDMPIEVIIEDDGALAQAMAWIISPGGTNRTLWLAPFGDGAWGAKVVFPEPGSYTLRVSAIDSLGNQAHSPPWRVEATSKIVPSFSLQGTTWKVGDSVQILVFNATADQLAYFVRQEGDLVSFGNVSVATGKAVIPLAGAGPGEVELGLQLEGEPGLSLLSVQVSKATDLTATTSDSPKGATMSRNAAGPSLAFLLVAGAAWVLRRRP